jgi:crotonobetainyl-CoA:carnitine CoA-transferase CaiB-like acyl-CoA transferase
VSGEFNPTKPLEGVRVADFFWLIAGDFGAEVVRIESMARPDQIREGGVWPPPERQTEHSRNGTFNDCNTNKLSITLDLNTPEAIEIAKELVARSDIVTNNFTGDRMDRWGLGYEELRRIKPDIIMLTMPVMGTTGPYLKHGANGNGVIAYGGINMGMGFPDRPPTGMGPLYSDFSTPFFAVSAMMAALHHRERTGEGQFIDLAQVEATVSLLGTQVLGYTANGVVPERAGNRSLDVSPHGVFRCAGEDRWMAIATASDGEWSALCEAMDRPGLGADPRFASFEARKANEDALEAEIEAWTSQQDAWAATELLQASGVAAGVVESLEDMVTRDPHLRERHFVDLPGYDDGLTYVTHGQPARMDGKPAELTRPPLIGEHNEHVLKELLGVSDERYIELLVNGVIY